MVIDVQQKQLNNGKMKDTNAAITLLKKLPEIDLGIHILKPSITCTEHKEPRHDRSRVA